MLNKTAHSIDPYRLTTIANHGDRVAYEQAGLNNVTDIVGWNVYNGWYGGDTKGFAETVDEEHRNFPQRILAVGEYGAGSDKRLHSLHPQSFDFSIEYQQKYHEDQKNITNMGGTMRLGAYECVLKQGTKVFDIYKKEHIQERHRHRYEFNNAFQKEYEKLGMMCVGKNPESDLVEIVEIPSLKWYIGTQFHPEYSSTVLKPHPLFLDFIKTVIANKK